MNQGQGQLTAALQMKPVAPTCQPEGAEHISRIPAFWPGATDAGTHAAQFVYIIQNSISLQDRGQQKASSLYQN